MAESVEEGRGKQRPVRIGGFEMGLAALVLTALGIRVVYAVAVAPHQPQPGDQLLYHALARSLAEGDGYNLETVFLGDYPTASHPPLYSLYLALFTKLGLASFAAHRVVSCLLGAAAVALIGLLGRRLAGPRVGLIAAGLAAVYPQLFMIDGTLIAESLYAPVIVLVLLMAYRVIDRPSLTAAGALGAAIGLATLTRSDGILLLVLIVPLLAWRVAPDVPQRLRLMGVATLATGLILSPWLIRNWAQFDRLPLLSTNGALTQQATNCDETYYGPSIGFVGFGCALRSKCLEIREEVPQSECLLREARDYAGEHLSRVPVVAAARVARMWNVFGTTKDLSYSRTWGREAHATIAGRAMYYVLVVLSAYGTWLLWRRRVSLLPLIAMLVLASGVAVLAFGFSRYRLPAEPVLVVLAAVAIGSLIDRWRPGDQQPGTGPAW